MYCKVRKTNKVFFVEEEYDFHFCLHNKVHMIFLSQENFMQQIMENGNLI